MPHAKGSTQHCPAIKTQVSQLMSCTHSSFVGCPYLGIGVGSQLQEHLDQPPAAFDGCRVERGLALAIFLQHLSSEFVQGGRSGSATPETNTY